MRPSILLQSQEANPPTSFPLTQPPASVVSVSNVKGGYKTLTRKKQTNKYRKAGW